MFKENIIPSKKVKKKIPWILISFGLVALIIIIAVIGYYKIIFSNYTIDANTEHFGQFGDYVGGTLNPILAFLSFIALLYTIKIQTDELKLSREELEQTSEELRESRIAQQEQSESLKLQNKATELQIFENTFFQLINLYSNTRDNFILKIEYDSRKKLYLNKYFVQFTDSFTAAHKLDISGDYKSIEAIKWYLKSLKEHYNLDYNFFNKENEEYTGSYFGQIYQILKFIKESRIDNKQRYVNIFRAQFSKDELEFLFYHCLGLIGRKHFQGYVEKYEFFEHISLNNDIEKQLLEYDIKAFGKNEEIIKKYNTLKEKQ